MYIIYTIYIFQFNTKKLSRTIYADYYLSICAFGRSRAPPLQAYHNAVGAGLCSARSNSTAN